MGNLTNYFFYYYNAVIFTHDYFLAHNGLKLSSSYWELGGGANNCMSAADEE